MNRGINAGWRSAALMGLLSLVSLGSLHAQDHTVLFSTSDPGVSTAITNWGLDTGWANFDNMQRGLLFMGTNNVTVVQVAFEMNAPLTNNDLTPAQKTDLTNMVKLASMATSATKWNLSCGTGAGVDASYQSDTGTVYPDRWAAAMAAWQRNYHKSFWLVQGFNEPDYGWGQGSQQNLYDILGYCQAATNFTSSVLSGGCTLSCDAANSWYNYIAGRVGAGTTHCLAGSVSSYVSFIQNVLSQGDMPFNPEAHNLCEVLIGANYGLQGVIWWGTAELARGDLVKASQGQRLAYAEDWANWTAAAVYRGTNGSVQAFLGGSERMATTTGYRLFARDRDVFYDGYGPQRDYLVTVPGGSGYMVGQPNAERVVNISWGSDVQPALKGRYLVVNRNSHKVLEVPGGSTSNGTLLDQNVYTGALYQQWDIAPIPSTSGGDFSYFTITAAHDGVTADESGYSYANGNALQQWNGGTNLVEQWYLQYAGNGYFKIRSRWSNKVVGVYGGSLNNGAQVVQWDDTGSADQQWRLIPATVSNYDFVAPAAPTGVTATPNAVSVQLTWNPNTEPDLAGYTVLRGTTNGGPYDIVARGLTNTAFTDKAANQARAYFYVVQAVDRSLNTSSNSAQVSATPTLASTLVTRYGFDGNTSDGSGNANDATLSGTPGFGSGKSGQALILNGTSQYAMAPAGVMAGVTNFTLSAWVYWNGGAAWQRIFDFGNDTTHYLFLTPASGSGTLRFAITTNATGGEQIVQASPLPSGSWQQVAVTFNGSALSLYTNGLLAASGPANIAPASFNPVLNYLGRSQYPADPLFNGSLDDVRIYNYALSAAQVAQLLTPVPIATYPTNIVVLARGTNLTLAWPSDHTGWRLQVQTNGLTPANWVDVPASAATNSLSLPMALTIGSVFYRLVYP